MANGSTTVEEIWDLIKETRMDMREHQAEFYAGMNKFYAGMNKFNVGMDKIHAGMDKFNVGMEELRASQLKTERQLEKSDRRFNTQWGRLVESLVESSLVPLLQERGIEVRQTSRNVRVSFDGEDGSLKQKEFDILVVNGTEVVVVEVKTTLTPDKVKYFLSAMEDFERYLPDYRHKRVYGAVAYLRSESEADLYAERQGLFVIRATGDSARIVNSKGFKPKVFPSQGNNR